MENLGAGGAEGAEHPFAGISLFLWHSVGYWLIPWISHLSIYFLAAYTLLQLHGITAMVNFLSMMFSVLTCFFDGSRCTTTWLNTAKFYIDIVPRFRDFFFTMRRAWTFIFTCPRQLFIYCVMELSRRDCCDAFVKWIKQGQEPVAGQNRVAERMKLERIFRSTLGVIVVMGVVQHILDEYNDWFLQHFIRFYIMEHFRSWLHKSNTENAAAGYFMKGHVYVIEILLKVGPLPLQNILYLSVYKIFIWSYTKLLYFAIYIFVYYMTMRMIEQQPIDHRQNGRGDPNIYIDVQKMMIQTIVFLVILTCLMFFLHLGVLQTLIAFVLVMIALKVPTVAHWMNDRMRRLLIYPCTPVQNGAARKQNIWGRVYWTVAFIMSWFF